MATVKDYKQVYLRFFSSFSFQWSASPINDVYADSVLVAILKCEKLSGSKSVPRLTTVDHTRFKVIFRSLISP